MKEIIGMKVTISNQGEKAAADPETFLKVKETFKRNFGKSFYEFIQGTNNAK